MIINRSNQWEIPYQWKRDLPHNVNLPKLIGMTNLEPLNRLYRREADPIEVMLDQNPPNRVLMY